MARYEDFHSLESPNESDQVNVDSPLEIKHLLAQFSQQCDRLRNASERLPAPILQQILAHVEKANQFVDGYTSGIFPVATKLSDSPLGTDEWNLPVPQYMYKTTPFVQKLYSMVNDPDCQEGIRWNTDGTQILVVPRKLQDVLLHHFAFDKGRSLLKQLNAYGFVSVSSQKREELAYHHPAFQRGRESLLHGVQLKPRSRKRKGGLSDTETSPPPQTAHSLLTGHSMSLHPNHHHHHHMPQHGGNVGDGTTYGVSVVPYSHHVLDVWEHSNPTDL